MASIILTFCLNDPLASILNFQVQDSRWFQNQLYQYIHPLPSPCKLSLHFAHLSRGGLVAHLEQSSTGDFRLGKGSTRILGDKAHLSAHWEGSGSKRGKRESYLDSRLKDMSRTCLCLTWPNISPSLGLLGKNLGPGNLRFRGRKIKLGPLGPVSHVKKTYYMWETPIHLFEVFE